MPAEIEHLEQITDRGAVGRHIRIDVVIPIGFGPPGIRKIVTAAAAERAEQPVPFADPMMLTEYCIGLQIGQKARWS